MNLVETVLESEIVSHLEAEISSEEERVDSLEREKAHKCTYPGCQEAFLRPSRLARHIRQHTGERPYKCDYDGCEKSYTNSSHLKRHCQSHDIVKQSFKCSKCSLTISNRHNLRRHYERVHAENEKFSCKECGLKFSKEQRYKEHSASHNGVALYECKICSKQCMTLRALNKHERSHGAEKEYPCTATHCSEVFSKWSLLRKHRKSKHVNEFKCGSCDKVFLTKGHLKLHSVIHVDDRSVLPCPYKKCPRFYFFQRNLDHHIRSNHLGKKYHCDICDLNLSSKQKIAEHIKKIHLLKQKKTPSKSKQRKRKDAGIAKKSMLSKLAGLDLPRVIEKDLLNRKTKVQDGSEDFTEAHQNRVENSEGIGKENLTVPNRCNGAVNGVGKVLIVSLNRFDEDKLIKESTDKANEKKFRNPGSDNLLNTTCC